ncbi:MAG: hypothetical protein RLZZ135_1770 [Cyanobacteriota bacterium]|jgi:hypothetical protein
MLPLLVENASAVRFGYLVYLIYSIMFWVIANLTIRVLGNEEPESVWLRVYLDFGERFTTVVFGDGDCPHPLETTRS